MKEKEKKRELLIVDDAEINREILRSIFQGHFKIIEAENGEQAIEQIRKHRTKLALILLDLRMPKKSGLDVCAFMKKHGLVELIPVIVVTGESTTDTDYLAYEYGAADVIYKPYARHVVLKRALNIVELYDSRAELRRLLNMRTEELRLLRTKLQEVAGEKNENQQTTF